MFYFQFLARMIHVTHTSPGRLLRHLHKLARDGEALLARPPFLTPLDEVPWDVRVWRCLDKIVAPHTFDGVSQLDRADAGDIDLLDFDRPCRSALEEDELLRRRIRRRLVTLAGVIEKVEALAESSSGRSSTHDG